MSDLRDALARNQLKLPDLSGPWEFVAGDPLIRANRELATAAAGVYRRGEVYLRWLQRGSAVAFGTWLGRWCMLFFVLPVLGAVATIIAAQEVLHLLHLPHHLDHMPLTIMRGVLSVFYLLLMHWPAFRRAAAHAVHAGWATVRAVLFDIPVLLLHLPAVRSFLESRPYLFMAR